MDWQQYFLQGLEFLFLGLGTYFDLKYREIPMFLLGSFGVLGVLFNIIWSYQSIQNTVLGVGIGSMFLLIGWLTKESIGYGDGIGLMIIGLMEGLDGTIPIIFFSFLLSGLYGLWRLAGMNASRDERLSFYPFMLIALLGGICL